MAERRIITVGVDERFDDTRVVEVPAADRTFQPGVVGLGGEAEQRSSSTAQRILARRRHGPAGTPAVDVGLLHPAAQRLRGDPKIERELRHAQVTTMRDPDHISIELGWELLRHRDILPAVPRPEKQMSNQPTAISSADISVLMHNVSNSRSMLSDACKICSTMKDSGSILGVTLIGVILRVGWQRSLEGTPDGRSLPQRDTLTTIPTPLCRTQLEADRSPPACAALGP